MLIATNGKLMTYKLNGNQYLASDVLFDQHWSTCPIIDRENLQELRLKQTTVIDSIDVVGEWGDAELQSIILERPVEISSHQHLILWHEEYEKLHDFFYPKAIQTPINDIPLTPRAEGSVLLILAAMLADSYGMNWVEEDHAQQAKRLKQDLQRSNITLPMDDRTLAKWINKAMDKMELIREASSK